MFAMRDIFNRTLFSVCSVFLVSCLLACCVISPLPQPPNLDPGRMSATPCSDCPDPGGVIFRGEPGAVTGENATLWVINLDRDLPDQTFEAEADGSFEILVVGDIRDTFQFQVRLPDESSGLFDLIVDPESGEVDQILSSGGDCEYVDIPGICTVMSVDSDLVIQHSFEPDNPDAEIPDWFDLSRSNMTVESPLSVDDSFPCDCHLITSGPCSPGGCTPR